MSKRGNKEYLNDILECIERILHYTKDMSYTEFENNELVQDAVIRNIEIIREATKNLADQFLEKYPNINWSDIAQTRDKVIHHYFGVNLEIIWDIISEELTDLHTSLKKILKDLK